MKKITFALLLCLLMTSLSLNGDVDAKSKGEKRNFSITGYYSPLPNQRYFLTGSYESEIRLNGHGKNAADGTPVFPGMIAAPKTYAFGTKICLPSFGCGTVHDRGGAIVEKGGRSIAKHDRLDLWMGYGEEGLRRALAWGLQHSEGEIFPKGSDIQNSVNFSVPLPLNQILDFPAFPYFSKNLNYGDRHESVKDLQEGLAKIGVYQGVNDGYYSLTVKKAVLDFQLKYFVIDDENTAGAGRFGPKTRTKFSEVLYDVLIQETIQSTWEKFSFDTNQKRGKRNADIVKLQEILVQAELLGVPPTGFFGPLTEEALTEFQMVQGIIRSKNQRGAGQLGPKTRDFLNTLLENKKQLRAEENNRVLAYQKVRNYFLTFAGKPSQQRTALR